MPGTTLFPGAIDTNAELNENRVVNDIIPPADNNNLAAAVKAVEAAIGKTASPASSSLRYLLAHGTIANELLVPNSENLTLSGGATGNNVAVAATTAVVRVTAQTSSRDLTGVAGGVAGRMLIIRNVGATLNVVLKNDSGSSSAGNRLLLGADITLTPHQSALLQWDTADNHWDLVASGFGSSGGGSGTVYVIRGTYSAATTYAINDIVLYDDGVTESSYVATAPSTGSTPPSANWQLFARGGTEGLPGAQGIPGIGLTGAPGPSAEALLAQNIQGAVTLDANTASCYNITLDGNADITLEDSSGRAASAITVRLYQGGSGTNVVNWINVQWITEDSGAGPNLPPVLSTNVGDVNVLTFDQFNGVWFGYAPGAGVTAPPGPDVFGTLGLEAWQDVADSTAHVGTTAAPTAAYILGPISQIGAKRGGLAWVVTTRDDNIDPPIPQLTGGGASNWTVLATEIFGTATARRRGTLFGVRNVSAAAASAYTISLTDAAASHTGCVLKVVRTTGIVPDTWITLANATAVAAHYNGAGETASVPKVALGTPQDTADRAVMFVAANLSNAMTLESGFVLVGAPLDMINPTIRAWATWNPDTWDASPTHGFASANWAAVAVEMEQGGIFTPPPVGIPTIDLEVMLAGFDTTDQTIDYVTSAAGFVESVGNGASVLVGNERMAICDVVNTTGTSIDPVQPTLAGGGVTTWNVAATRIIGASTSRRRLTRFIGWQLTAGASAPLTVGVGGQATTSISILLQRTPQTDATQLALALSNTKMRYYLDAGEVAAGPATLAADQLAVLASGSRVCATAIWNASVATLGTVTPAAPYELLSGTAAGSAPATFMEAIINRTGPQDRAPSISWTGGTLNWVIMATELGQAV